MSQETYESGVDLSAAENLVCDKCGVPLQMGRV